MGNKLMTKWVIILGTVIAAVWFLYPSIEWYTKTAQERSKLEFARMRPKHILNLGLDLKGGTSLLLELDVSKLERKEKPAEALARAIEIIRNRIDQYGVGETPINRQGDNLISVQLPGIADPTQAEELIGKTALLEFHLVADEEEAQKIKSKIADLPEVFTASGTITEAAQKLLPPEYTIARSKDEGGDFYILHSTVPVTGAYLENARVETGGQNGYPYISFKFNGEGGKKFERFTGANVGKRIAIVLDGVVHSAPVVNQRIGGGSGIIEGQFTLEDASRLAIVLRSGALPAPVRIIEKRTIGPGLGEDSIRKGLTACAVGFLAVALFMVIYYKLSGLVADIAMFLDFLFLLAIMAYFGSTLTMPGIAGMLLALAMDVDANVLILERMREEIALGKPVAMVIPTGYDKAWNTIFDAKITAWIAAIFLFQFGSGPVKGFAVTLTLGLLIGMFTAVFLTRAIYEFWLTSNPKELSI